MNAHPLVARLVKPRLLQALSAWEVGGLTLRFPDGQEHRFGREGATPSATVEVRNEAFLSKFALRGDLGAGESYLDGDWRADDLTTFLSLALENRRHLPLDTALTKALNLGSDLLHWANANTRRGSRRNIRAHYDLSNELFALFLDETMTYSSAVFAHEDEPLADAQRNKYRRLAEKVHLGPGDHLLEIGCGWGGFALFAAKTYGCRVTGITISPPQLDLARRRVAQAGLQGRVDLRLLDYRDLQGRYDKIVSIEMFEALGLENWPVFFRKVDEVLAPNGLVALQAIAIPDYRFDEYRRHCDWLQKHIFPGSLLASLREVTKAMSAVSPLGVHHLEEIGVHYALTLRRWREAFLARLPEVGRLGFDDRFVRRWEYYLCVCEAAFATRTLQNLQVVLTRPQNASLPGIASRRGQARAPGGSRPHSSNILKAYSKP